LTGIFSSGNGAAMKGKAENAKILGPTLSRHDNPAQKGLIRNVSQCFSFINNLYQIVSFFACRLLSYNR
jgi:hypothetical protein